MYDEIYDSIKEEDLYKEVDPFMEYDLEILDEYVNNHFDESDDKQIWFDKVRELGVISGYARDTKTYKKRPIFI